MSKLKNMLQTYPGMVMYVGDRKIDLSGVMDRYCKINSRIRTKRFEKENQNIVTGRTVFLGDSITMLLKLRRDFPEIPAYNRGIDSETTWEIGARLKESVYDLKPSRVVFLAGTNDLFLAQHTPEQIIRDYAKVLDDIVAFDPTIEVFCESVYPLRNSIRYNNEGLNGPVRELNEEIRALCAERGFTYIDVWSHLVDGKGELRKELSLDGTHPNKRGYKVVSSVVTPYLNGTVSE